METSALTPVLKMVTEFFTAAVGWMSDIAAEIIADPLLTLLVVCVPLVGLGIGMLGRLFRL